jgi:hypothetical protein
MSNDLLVKILEKQEKIGEDINEIKVVIAVQEEHLKTHIRRTELAEENISLLRTEVEPIKRHVQYINGALKFMGLLSVLVTLIASILKVVDYVSRI